MKVNSEKKLLTLGDAFELYTEDAKSKKNGIKIAPRTLKTFHSSFSQPSKYVKDAYYPYL